MPKLKTLSETYNSCSAEGYLRNLQEINIDKIKLLISNAETNLSSAKIISQAISKNAKEWMNVFTLHYEALRTCAEALLYFEKIESSNHQCLFAVLCTKYAKLEFDWDFFENLRIKRNRINYYGEQINYNDWKYIELKLNIYISTLKNEVVTKLK